MKKIRLKFRAIRLPGELTATLRISDGICAGELTLADKSIKHRQTGVITVSFDVKAKNSNSCA